METREELKSALEAEYKRWDALINKTTEDQWQLVPEGTSWTLKDELAHLMSWQEVSNARLSAGVLDELPVFPKWLQGGDPDTDSDELTNEYNARIYEAYHKVPREVVIDSWRDGFMTIIRTINDLSEEALFTAGTLPWLPGYTLKDVVNGTLHHHREHYEEHAKTLMND